MRFAEAKGRKVVSTTTADTVGKVHGFVVDPKSRAVLALELKKTSSGDTLRWSNITGFGHDAVTVSGADQITEADEDVAALQGKNHLIVGKRVLTTSGDELGKVIEVEFDHESGAVTSLILPEADVAGDRLVGAGSYAVVVKAE